MNQMVEEMKTDAHKDQLRDAYHIAFLLRQKLVADVVPAILHHAGIFERHTYSTEKTTALVITQNTAPSTCLMTPPIQSSARVKFPVRKVVFAISSSDQGWASNRDAGSWTWFTAGKRGHEENSNYVSKADERSDRFLSQEREIYRNDVASSDMKLHIVEWSIDSNNDEERQWISALQNGDRIAVRAWAQFEGWQNKVKSVSVAIYTAAVV